LDIETWLVFDESTGTVPDFGVARGFVPEWTVALELVLVLDLTFTRFLEFAPAFNGPFVTEVGRRE
jgi:hypothetical protein